MIKHAFTFSLISFVSLEEIKSQFSKFKVFLKSVYVHLLKRMEINIKSCWYVVKTMRYETVGDVNKINRGGKLKRKYMTSLCS